MPTIEIPLGVDRKFVGDGLYLSLARTQMASPKYLEKQIIFTGCFRSQEIFTNVQFVKDDPRRQVVLALSLEDGQVVS
jgi:hypothetical protein